MVIGRFEFDNILQFLKTPELMKMGQTCREMRERLKPSSAFWLEYAKSVMDFPERPKYLAKKHVLHRALFNHEEARLNCCFCGTPGLFFCECEDYQRYREHVYRYFRKKRCREVMQLMGLYPNYYPVSTVVKGLIHDGFVGNDLDNQIAVYCRICGYNKIASMLNVEVSKLWRAMDICIAGDELPLWHNHQYFCGIKITIWPWQNEENMLVFIRDGDHYIMSLEAIKAFC
ncbi:MAG: hypothetical protein P4L69_05500 [Desulfosporosinus sp.]|nr:hypothetical protein [Desulfosporosinus sp.]